MSKLSVAVLNQPVGTFYTFILTDTYGAVQKGCLIKIGESKWVNVTGLGRLGRVSLSEFPDGEIAGHIQRNRNRMVYSFS